MTVKNRLFYFVGLILISLLSFSFTPVSAESQYIVKEGDSLSKIAEQIYGKPEAWITIYQANRNRIKDDGNFVKVGAKLKIPEMADEDIANQVARTEAVQDKAEEVFLVTGDNYAPFSGEDLPQKGMFTEIVDIIFKRMGYNPTIQFMDWQDGFDMTYKRGVFSATFPYLKNNERLRQFYYSEPIFETMIFAYRDVNSPFQYSHEEDLKGRKVCRPEGYYTHDLERFVKADVIELVRPEDIDECFDFLVEGKVDFVSVNEMTGNQQVVEKGLRDRVEPSDKIMSVEGLYVIFPKSTANGRVLQYKFNQELEKMKQSGELNGIIQRHVNHYYDSLTSGSPDSKQSESSSQPKVPEEQVNAEATMPTGSPIRSGSEF
ncbi:transporter substrate-binding domain-containing protein [uncultured Thiohalocapsa sp.]|uniref:transporter substrate-binding domain-containing protein n=1 Tax=uncultured Thiohalocapsa sp. TaxID=768990 RepID=UPI0025F3D6D5|nr:transporter substrate-binding domain-containing protein [uncultured Thiohalocapsa sp.]